MNERLYNIGRIWLRLIQYTLIVLKLCGVVKWRWCIVLLPTITCTAVVAVALMVIGYIKWREVIEGKEE